MTSIFSNNSFFNKETTPKQTGQYMFGQQAAVKTSCSIDDCFSKKAQFQRQSDENSKEQQQLSLFVDNLIFEENQQDIIDEPYDTQAQAQIESNLLDMIDDEPLTNFNSLEQSDAKSEENNMKTQDVIGQQLKRNNSQELSPASPTTQASDDAQSNSIFSACSNNSIFQSPTFCQQTFQQVQVQDFAQILAESSPEAEDQQEKKNNFEFPDGGWECSQCSNYNFKGRKQCFRCKKEKDENDIKGKPAHMKWTEQERVVQKANKVTKNQNKKQWPKKKASKNQDQNESGHTRPGDWVCVRCQNFNYSFRDCCNKCGLLIQEHNYYTANNIDPNTVYMNQMQNQAQLAFNQPQGQLYQFNQNVMPGQQSNTQIFALMVPPTYQQQQQQWFPAC